MRYTIFPRGEQDSLDIKQKLIALFESKGFINDNNNPEVVVTIGGDGTFLRAVQHHLPKLENLSFVGIHSGSSLGFFCDYAGHEINLLIDEIDDYYKRIFKYGLIQIKRIFKGGHDIHYAVNEFRIENPFFTLIADIDINGEQLEKFHGNGLIVASSLGSTAYNKSLGGALVDKQLTSLQLTEIAGIDNKSLHTLGSSLVLTPDKIIGISGHFEKTIIGYDHLVINDDKIPHRVEISMADKKIAIIHRREQTYVQILKKTFIEN
jgi:NAD+ kinase